VTDLAIVLDATVGYDPADAQTAASVGNIPKSYTDYLQLTALRGARVGLVPALLERDPADSEVAVVVRKAIEEMKGQGAEIVEVSIPNLTELLRDPANGFLLIRQDFKFDLNAYLAAHPSAPVRTLEEVLAAGKFHPAVETNLRNAQAVESRDTEEYLAHIVKRNILREAILKAMADSRVEALAYPRRSAASPTSSARRRWASIASSAPTPACRPLLSRAASRRTDCRSGSSCWAVPERTAIDQIRLRLRAGTRHRRPPASTPALDRP